MEGRDPLEDFRIINAELELFDPELRAKPMLVALNKIDLAEARDNLRQVRAALEKKGHPIFPISAATGEGVEPLMNAVGAELRELEQLRREQAEKPQERRRYTLANVDERAWEVRRRSAHHFDVVGIGIERFTKMTNFANDDAVTRFQRVLESSGISEELTRQGIQPGDVVHIADHELVWGDEEPEWETAGRRGRKTRAEAAAESAWEEEE